MKVKELILFLQKQDPEAYCVIYPRIDDDEDNPAEDLLVTASTGLIRGVSEDFVPIIEFYCK